MKQYVTIKKTGMSASEFEQLQSLCNSLSLSGTEVFMDDVRDRTKSLYAFDKENQDLIQYLQSLCVKRIHCSYWAYPTSFLLKNNFAELVERFGSEKNVAEYYGDLTGEHMFNRWVQEYMIATKLHAQSYTFHLIDYAPIDGMWEFTISKADIRQAMIAWLQHFLNLLLQKGLLSETSPKIEVENAGWGLEHGMQSAEDFMMLYDQLYDPYNKVKLGWDVNHLLHAVGFDKEKNAARFFLPPEEITAVMKTLEKKYCGDPAQLVHKWLEHNILFAKLIQHVGSIHLSDCALKETEYFSNGVLNEKYHSKIASLSSWEEREDYGVKIVLSEYDSHKVLGTGILNAKEINKILNVLQKNNPNIVLLHELKNSTNLRKDLKTQINSLGCVKVHD